MGGGAAPNYRNEMTTALGQANLPKSPLAQDFNNRILSASPSIFEALLNAQNLGNSAFGGPGSPQRTTFATYGEGQQPGLQLSGTNTANQGNGLVAPNLAQAPVVGTGLDIGNMQQDPLGLAALRQGIQAPQFQFSDPFTQIMQRLSGNIPQVQGQSVQAGQISAPQAQVTDLSLQRATPQNVNPMNITAPNVNLQGFNPNADISSAINPQDSDYYRAVTDVLTRKQDRDVANLRASFSGTGTSRGSPAFTAESFMRGEQLPQLAAALGGIRQQEVGNEIARRNLLLGQDSQSLEGRGQDLSALLANAQNFLQAGGMNQGVDLQAQLANQQSGLQATNLNNLFGLQQRGQNVDLALANAGNSLGAGQANLGAQMQAGLANQQNNLAAQQSNQGAFLQQLAQMLQGAQGQGQLNLGQNQLAAQTGLDAQNLQTQRGSDLLNSQNNFLQTLSQLALGNQQNLAQQGQFNAGQGNQFNLTMAQMQQQAIESQIQRAFQGLNNLLGLGGNLAQAGTPGSPNVNLSNPTQGTGSGLGGILGGLGQLAGGLSGLPFFGGGA